MKTASPLRVTIRLRISPTESRSKVRLSSPRAIKAQRTKLPQLSKTVVREIVRKMRTAIWRFLWVCCVNRQTGAHRRRIFRGPARSIDFAAQQEGLGPLARKDIEGNLKKAGANWPTLSQQKAL